MTDTGPAPAAPVAPVAPPWWQEYRKAVITAAIGLLAALTDLGVALPDGVGTAEWVHVAIVFLSTVLSTAGVAAFGNTYSRETLQAKLAGRA